MPSLSLFDHLLMRHGPLAVLLLLLLCTALLVAVVNVLWRACRPRASLKPPVPPRAVCPPAFLPRQRVGPVGAARD